MITVSVTESIERATLAAVPPQALEEFDGWLLGLDDGSVGRTHSAAPLRHQAPEPGVVDQIADRYRAVGLAPLLRIPRVACFDPLRRDLAEAHWSSGRPTLVQICSAPASAALRCSVGDVSLGNRPDDGWITAFLGSGPEPADAASRLAILLRSADTVFASLRVGRAAVAVGAACLAHGWTGVHGMRTGAAWRGRGFASHILQALAREGAARGIGRAFLQVEESNTAAQSLYAKAGFRTAWAYEYWRRL